MRNLAEDHPTVEFGWRCGGSSAGGVLRTLGKVERWRSPGYGSAVEVRMESNPFIVEAQSRDPAGGAYPVVEVRL